MKKTKLVAVFGLFITGFLSILSPAFALDRNSLIKSARSSSSTTNGYNIVRVVVGNQGTLIVGGEVDANTQQTINNAQMKIQELRNRLRNLH